MKVLIAMPTMGSLLTRCYNSILCLDRSDITVMFTTHDNSTVFEARNQLTLLAIENNCDYILWIDSDMCFPPHTLKQLLTDAEEGRDYVSGIYFKRQLPTAPVFCKDLKWDTDPETGNVIHGVELYEDYPKNQVFEIAGSGFGCVLTRTEMIKEIAESFAVSPFQPLPCMGEDYSFCWRAAKLGKKMYCDSRVKAGHIGTFIYDEGIYLQQRRSDG